MTEDSNLNQLILLPREKGSPDIISILIRYEESFSRSPIPATFNAQAIATATISGLLSEILEDATLSGTRLNSEMIELIDLYVSNFIDDLERRAASTVNTALDLPAIHTNLKVATAYYGSLESGFTKLETAFGFKFSKNWRTCIQQCLALAGTSET